MAACPSQTQNLQYRPIYGINVANELKADTLATRSSSIIIHKL